MPSFPVLRLPHVALTEVLRCLDPIDLYIFAQCSSKASFVVPLVKSKSFRIGVNNESIRKVTINECYTFSHEKLNRYRPFCCAIRESEHLLTIYSREGFDKFIWNICNLFKSSIRNVCFKPDRDFDEIIAFLVKAWQTKTSIEEFEISGYELSADVMRKTLDAVQRINISLVLCIKPFVLVAFGYNFSGRLPERLKVESAYWFTMRNLMQARTCAHIDLYSSRLTIQDMQEFMSRWKQGEFPNLEYLQASSNSFNITDYPDFEDRQNTVQRNKRIKNSSSSRYMTRGVKIQRDNGQKAEYRIYGNWFQFFVLSEWDI